MDCSRDSELAEVIREKNFESVNDFRDQLGSTIMKELILLLEGKDDDRNRYGRLAKQFLNIQLFESAEATFLLSLPEKELIAATARAKLFEEIGRWYHKAGNSLAAGIKFSIAARLDPSNTRLVNMAKLMYPPLEFKLSPPWEALTAINGRNSFTELGDLSFFPELRDDVLRNDFAKRFHSKRFDSFLGDFIDCSFLVKWQDLPAVRIECDIRGDQNFLSCFEVPIIFAINPQIPQDTISTAISIAYICLLKTAKHLGSVYLLQLEELDVPVITPTFTLVDLLKGKPEFMDRISIDLKKDEHTLYKDIRKGHKSNIKWGKSNLELCSWDSFKNEEYINIYYALHEKTNRFPGITDPKKLIQLLQLGMIELTITMLDNQPKSLIITGIDGENAHYMASVGHGKESEALTHWPLYNSILQCKKRGMKKFDLGYVHPNSIISPSNKKHQISHFKRGFSSIATKYTWWLIKQNFNNVTL